MSQQKNSHLALTPRTDRELIVIDGESYVPAAVARELERDALFAKTQMAKMKVNMSAIQADLSERNHYEEEE